MNRKVLLNIVLQPLRFLSILKRFIVHELNAFQVVFNTVKKKVEFYTKNGELSCHQYWCNVYPLYEV